MAARRSDNVQQEYIKSAYKAVRDCRNKTAK